MNKANGFLAVRILVALCAVLTFILWAAGQHSGGGGRQISGPGDLRLELRRAQMLSPPSDSPVPFDAGRLAYVPGASPFESEFVEGLASRLEPDGLQAWPVTVYEDRASRDTVFLNADGAEVGRLPPDGGYDPMWAARYLFPGWQFSAAAALRHDPSRVVLSAQLVGPGSGAAAASGARAGRPGKGASGAGSASSGHRTASAPAGYKDYLVVWNSSSNVWLGGDSGSAAGVESVDAGYTHGVALHADGSLTRVGLDPATLAASEQRFEGAGAALASAGGLGDTAVLGFDGALRRLSDTGEPLDEPADAGNVTGIVSGEGFLLALKNGGAVAVSGEEGAPVPPPGLSGVAAIAAGPSFCVALRHNGSVAAWGDARVATNIASGVAAVSASRRGAHCLALNRDGTVTAWGDDGSGQCRVPAGLSGVTAVAAGGYHSVALKSDGTVACWGAVRRAPPLLTNVVSIGASYLDAFAVTADGTVAVWGKGCPFGARLSAKTHGACEILEAAVVDCGVYMAVVRAREGVLEGDADGDGVPGVEEVFLYGTDPLAKDAGAFARPAASAAEPAPATLKAPAVRAAGLRAGGAALYSFENGATYYADASKTDENDGLTWETAKRTIQAAVDIASPGDTVMVAPGTYGEGSRAAPGSSLMNRLVITNAVLVRSVGGAGAAVIEGSGTDAFDSVDAVRCVYMLDGILDGFTLTGGATQSFWSYDTAVDCGGGAVCAIGAADGTEVRNCVISNSVAYNGGGAVGHYGSEVRGLFSNCLILGNTACYGGAAYRCELMNCTVSGDYAWCYGSAAFYCGVTNSVVYGNGLNWWEYDPCCGSVAGYSCSSPLPDGDGNTDADPLFTDAANGDFTLQSGSPCVDTGCDDFVTAETDLLGNTRIQGGAVDMGAYEASSAHTLTLVDGIFDDMGMGGEIREAGSTVGVIADNPPNLCCFSGWQVSPDGTYLGVSFDASQPWTTVTMPNCDVTLTATYAAQTRTLTVVNGFGGGVLTVGSTACVSADFTQNPQNNWYFSGWQVGIFGSGSLGDSFDAMSATTTLTMPDCDVILIATFAAPTHTLTVYGGSGGGVFEAGSTVSVVAECPQYYEFLSWLPEYPGYESLGMSFNALQNPTTVTMPDCDVVLFANFYPTLLDSDGDGVSDFQDAFPLDPSAWLDTDGDGMPDELHGISTTGLVEDEDDDNDSMPDWWEIQNGYDPKDFSDSELDEDHDGYPVWQERYYGTSDHVWGDVDQLTSGWPMVNFAVYGNVTAKTTLIIDGYPIPLAGRLQFGLRLRPDHATVFEMTDGAGVFVYATSESCIVPPGSDGCIFDMTGSGQPTITVPRVTLGKDGVYCLHSDNDIIAGVTDGLLGVYTWSWEVNNETHSCSSTNGSLPQCEVPTGATLTLTFMPDGGNGVPAVTSVVVNRCKLVFCPHGLRPWDCAICSSTPHVECPIHHIPKCQCPCVHAGDDAGVCFRQCSCTPLRLGDSNDSCLHGGGYFSGPCCGCYEHRNSGVAMASGEKLYKVQHISGAVSLTTDIIPPQLAPDSAVGEGDVFAADVGIILFAWGEVLSSQFGDAVCSFSQVDHPECTADVKFTVFHIGLTTNSYMTAMDYPQVTENPSPLLIPADGHCTGLGCVGVMTDSLLTEGKVRLTASPGIFFSESQGAALGDSMTGQADEHTPAEVSPYREFYVGATNGGFYGLTYQLTQEVTGKPDVVWGSVGLSVAAVKPELSADRYCVAHGQTWLEVTTGPGSYDPAGYDLFLDNVALPMMCMPPFYVNVSGLEPGTWHGLMLRSKTFPMMQVSGAEVDVIDVTLSSGDGSDPKDYIGAGQSMILAAHSTPGRDHGFMWSASGSRLFLSPIPGSECQTTVEAGVVPSSSIGGEAVSINFTLDDTGVSAQATHNMTVVSPTELTVSDPDSSRSVTDLTLTEESADAENTLYVVEKSDGTAQINLSYARGPSDFDPFRFYWKIEDAGGAGGLSQWGSASPGGQFGFGLNATATWTRSGTSSGRRFKVICWFDSNDDGEYQPNEPRRSVYVVIVGVSFAVDSDDPQFTSCILTDNREATVTITLDGCDDASCISMFFVATPMMTPIVNKRGTSVDFMPTSNPLVWRTSKIYWYGVPPNGCGYDSAWGYSFALTINGNTTISESFPVKLPDENPHMEPIVSPRSESTISTPQLVSDSTNRYYSTILFKGYTKSANFIGLPSTCQYSEEVEKEETYHAKQWLGTVSDEEGGQSDCFTAQGIMMAIGLDDETEEYVIYGDSPDEVLTIAQMMLTLGEDYETALSWDIWRKDRGYIEVRAKQYAGWNAAYDYHNTYESDYGPAEIQVNYHHSWF